MQTNVGKVAAAIDKKSLWKNFYFMPYLFIYFAEDNFVLMYSWKNGPFYCILCTLDSFALFKAILV
jgi:hypothetical protein